MTAAAMDCRSLVCAQMFSRPGHCSYNGLMAFQQRPPRRPVTCPWCGEEMVPCEDGRAGRLCCPTGEPVEHRISGGRWYFNGRQNGLNEPFPPAPASASSLLGDGDDGDSDDADADPLDDALKIVRDAWKGTGSGS